MGMREKLIELLINSPGLEVLFGGEEEFAKNADWLIANGVTIQKWIPVTERIPDWKDGKVLVSTKYGFSICERTVNGRWKGQHANWITHWMPLPEAPNGERRTDD